MEIVDRIENIIKPYRNSVITIGNFDGVHIGHRVLFQEVINKAKAIDGTSIVMTFEPHPLRVLKQNNNPPLITLYEQKLELIESSGIDVLICVPFTLDFASLSAEEFVKDILVDRLGMKAIVIGKDYTFGKNRQGNLAFLKKYSIQMGFEVIVKDWIQPKNGLERVSSTRVRKLVAAGEIADAKQLLGRNYQIRGVVVSGRNRGGKLLGFPTANIKLHDELCPKTGVYAVTVECHNNKHKGVANIGYSPTFDDHVFTVEIHIFDFNENIVGEKIRVNFVARIRDEIKFSSISDLSDQIQKDIKTAAKILSK